ncbi:MAG: glycerol-3-phosphate acyltransferase [Herbinix sp.]|nr:glycerol-3-phosphate acyltransferase [Herbinix sp.]
MLVKTLLAMLISYIIGCINTGYYYTRLIYNKDIREVGTNVTGAMNVSRLAGKTGFIITFLGDGIKGALVVLLARSLNLPEWVSMLCILMVLLGHIAPVQLHFQGGKGMSTIFGALLAYQPMFILMLFLTCVVFYPFVRRFTITSLYAFLLFPLEVFLADYSITAVLFTLAYAVLIIFACRSNVKEYLKEKAFH